MSAGGDPVERPRAMPSGDVTVVEPWPRASSDSTPAEGRRLRISAPRTAKERPDEPAPWCITKSGPLPTGDVR